MKMLTLAALAGILALAPMAAGQAEIVEVSRLQRIQETGVLRVGTTGDFNPLAFRDPATNEIIGHQIDVVTKLAADIGVELELVPTTWATLITGLDADQYDIAVGTSVNTARALAAAFTIPWGENAFVPLVRAEDADKYRSWADLNLPEVTVGANLGTTMENFVKVTLPDATLRSVESPARDWQELLTGQVDVTISSLIEAAYLTKEYPELVSILRDQPANPFPMAFLVPQNDPIWINFLNTWITYRQAGGFFDELGVRWGLAAPGL